jgi:hypothetical protein
MARFETMLLMFALIVGGGSWIYFGGLNARTATKVAPAGKYVRTHVAEQQSSGVGVALTTQGPAVGVVSSGADRSLVETETATYQVAGLFTAGKGDELEVRTMVDRSKKLCIHGVERCFVLLE